MMGHGPVSLITVRLVTAIARVVMNALKNFRESTTHAFQMTRLHLNVAFRQVYFSLHWLKNQRVTRVKDLCGAVGRRTAA
jgi:hypothetical protein